MKREEIIDKLIKKLTARRKKYHISSLNDLYRGEVKLPYKDRELSAVVCRAMIRRASSPKQAISEYARVLRSKGKALIIFRAGHVFSKELGEELIAEHFDIEESNIIEDLGNQKWVAVIGVKKA